MNKDRLLSILNYWIEHNKEHGQEFRSWADDTDHLSARAADLLRDAATKLDEANESLQEARGVLIDVGKGG
jgi:hypothetical protein